MNTHLAIFAKFWQPGAVKTRLAETIGRAAAAAVYRESLRTLLIRFASVAASRELVFTPDDRRPEFRSLALQAWQLEEQGMGDLGQRMARFFERAFASGRSRVVLIGSDSPTVPSSYVDQAFDALEHHAVVLGPSEDGGYYLVGARGDRVPPIFFDMHWSTEQVLPQTIARLQRHNIQYALMPTWYDVDSAADLRRLYDELTQSTAKDPVWIALRDQAGIALGRCDNTEKL